MIRPRAVVLAGVALSISSATLAACFSERTTGTNVATDACNALIPPDAFGSSIVIIRDFTFTPAQVRVRPGTKVTWVNCEPQGTQAHTSTSDANVWSSPLLQPGSTYTREFTAAGAFPYHCDPHPAMRGSVTVE